MSGAFVDAIERLAREQSERSLAAIEEACERALQLDCGVLVVRRDGVVVNADPHPHVPYGQIYEVPIEGLDALLERMEREHYERTER